MRVLFDTRSRHFRQNPYVQQLADSLKPEIQVVGFSWRVALIGRYDIAHVHWPEYLLRPKGGALRYAAACLMALWLVRLRLDRTPLLRTMHDRSPRIQTSVVESLLLRVLNRMTVSRIWLTAPGTTDPSNVTARDVVIAHGDYQPWLDEVRRHLAAPAAPPAVEKRDSFCMLCFGILRPYKAFEQVMRATSKLPLDIGAHLHVIGAAPDKSYLSVLQKEAERAPDRISLVPKRATDAELYVALMHADLVLVPYADVFNSGVVLLALSARRPVAMKANGVTSALQAEFGREWVYLWDDTLDHETLADVIAGCRRWRLPVAMPPGRAWSAVGRKHKEHYRRLVATSIASE